MFEGMAQTREADGTRLSVTAFEDFTVAIGDLITPRERGRQDYRELSTAELLSPSDATLEATRRDADTLRREGHERISQALMSIGAALLGYAALMVGGFSRFGLWRQIMLAVVLVVAVKLVDNAALEFAGGGMNRLPAAYAASLLSLVICWVVLWIANGGLQLWRRGPAA
jgi:lipopolysaccharide export system permease protein